MEPVQITSLINDHSPKPTQPNPTQPAFFSSRRRQEKYYASFQNSPKNNREIFVGECFKTKERKEERKE